MKLQEIRHLETKIMIGAMAIMICVPFLFHTCNRCIDRNQSSSIAHDTVVVHDTICVQPFYLLVEESEDQSLSNNQHDSN